MIIEKAYELPGFHEPFSSLSHLLGAVIFLGLSALLLRRGQGDRARMIYLGVYSASCVLLLALSGVYHMLDRESTAHAVLARLDHDAIFLFIAGTFTPVHGILFRGAMRWGPLVVVWSLALAGVVLKSVFFNDVDERLGLALYLAMGWLGTVTVAAVVRRYGWRFVQPLILGGLAYSIGCVADYCRWPTIIPGIVQPHETFHIAVILGAYWHWQFVWKIAGGESSLKHLHNEKTQSGPAVNCDLVATGERRLE